MHEVVSSTGLIQQVLEARKQNMLETLSIEAATAKTPEFYRRLSNFFDQIHGKRDFTQLPSHIIDATIPTEEDEIKVTITERVWDIFTDYVIDMEDLDYVLVVSNQIGVLNSKKQANQPSGSYTITGSSSDVNPVWRRPMNTGILQDYSELMDVIQSPTTVLKPHSVTRR